MPQMSPIMWFSMFILFSMTLILFNQLMFFSFKIKKISFFKKNMNNIIKFNWKW
uniref:ATP synthase complex subunit 8 n=1 Tax=Ochrophlegma sp. TAMUIC IGC OR279 TaxID=2591245 RepID=A0A516IMT8_9ORTH|nr:ATP synthase F0 subunit 8 [Ochrophlegma sp. TAMUIC IGC OR279]